MYEKTVELPPSKPRITGISGLTERKLPLDATVLPKSLLAWVAARQNRGVQHAPKIYALPVENPTIGSNPRTLVADNQTQRDISTARRRWRLAKHSAATLAAAGPSSMKAALATSAPADIRSEDARPGQTLLQPEDLWALSHLLMLLKYPSSPLGVVVEHARYQQRVEMFVKPASVIKRMGYSLHGERYDRLEASLARLAQLIVIEEVYDPRSKQWAAEASEPLLLTLDTGRVSIEKGKPSPLASEGAPTRRHSEWRIAPGRPLIQMLNAAASDLVVIPPTLWKAAGRSRTLQFLALDAARFGYDDSSRMFPTKIKTLLARARLLDDNAHQHAFLQGELNLQPDGVSQRKTQTNDFRSAARRATQSLRRGARHIDQALARFSQRLGFADIRIERGAQADLSPSQQKKGHRSLYDRVQFVRWDGRLETTINQLSVKHHTPAMKDAFKQCNALLTSLRSRDNDQLRTHGEHLSSLAARVTHPTQSPRLIARTISTAVHLVAVAARYTRLSFTPLTTYSALTL